MHWIWEHPTSRTVTVTIISIPSGGRKQTKPQVYHTHGMHLVWLERCYFFARMDIEVLRGTWSTETPAEIATSGYPGCPIIQWQIGLA